MSDMHSLYVLPVIVSLFIDSALSDILKELGPSSDVVATVRDVNPSSTAPTAESWEQPPEKSDPKVYTPAQSQSHSVTRLIKTLSHGLNPQIIQEIPTEKRQKPVTLVGIRRHGKFPHQVINLASSTSRETADVAELMSPFNDIGQFWDEEFHY